MTAATLSLALILLAGCATVVAPFNAPGGVKLGQVVHLGGPRVRADRVLEDSRCPIDAQCIWEGRLVLRVTLLGGRSTRDIDLTLGSPTQIDGGTLTLVAAEPQRSSAGLIETQQLRFTFNFRSDR
jgi:hypothetical protein